MKKSLCVISAFLLVFLPSVKAQEDVSVAVNDTVAKPITAASHTSVEAEQDTVADPKMYIWNVDQRTGERTRKDIDTTLVNFHQKSLVDGQGLSVGYLGNWGSAAQSKIFFEREETSLFPFLDAFNYYYKTADEQNFVSTKTPYSNIFYQKAGGNMNKEERMKTQLTSNFGKKLNIGFDLDYVYSRGFYQYLANKQVTYNFYGSYISEKYEMHAFGVNNYYNNSENGGIKNDLYITNPNSISGFKGDSRDIEINLDQLWNRFKGRQVFVSNKYNVGYNDTIRDKFIPVASFILTTKYTDQQRRFGSRDDRVVSDGYTTTDEYFGIDNINYNTSMTNFVAADEVAYWSLKNTFAISLNEGFKEWVKFGLTAFIEQDFRKFALPKNMPGFDRNGNPIDKPIIASLVNDVKSQNSTVIGGKLSKQKGRLLRYNLGADLAILGSDLGEFRLNGEMATTIKFAGKDATVKATGYIKNLAPKFFENNQRTKYTYWNENLSDVRRVFVGGEISIPQTKTRLSGGVENLQNYIYYNSEGGISQSSKNVQIITLRADQNLKAGIFQFDNQIAYQLTSEKDIVPLPQISFYSNVYLLAKLGVLTVQLGADARFHTKYYAPAYNPSTLQFHNQQEVKVGSFPIATAYANLHLKKTRFFIMMYNVAQDILDPNYFSLPHYAVNPMVMKMGISWDFNN